MTDRQKGISDRNSDPNRYNTLARLQAQQAAIKTVEPAMIKQRRSDNRIVRWLNPVTYIKWVFYAFKWLCSPLLDENWREAIKVIVTAVAALGVAWTVIDSLANRKLTQERLITDRFSKSATLLANEKKTVRIAAIFALERIANDSPKDYWTIMDLLAEYVIEQSPLPKVNEIINEFKITEPISNDVQAILTVIGRRKIDQACDRSIDLSHRNLKTANLRDANLSCTDLSGSDLSNANLTGANLGNANLTGANLGNANLTGANLDGTDLKDSDISNQTQIDTKWKRVHQLVNEGGPKPKLSNADLSYAHLDGIDFSGIDLEEADLSGANLRGAIFSDSSLRSVNFYKADLRDSDLYEADLSGARLGEANLYRADLRKAHFSSTDFIGANLSEAKLSDVNLSDIHLSSTILINTDFTGTNLSGADLSNADLRFSNLSGADLSDANLKGANLKEVKNLTSEQIQSASNWHKATYDDVMRNKLGLPPETSETNVLIW